MNTAITLIIGLFIGLGFYWHEKLDHDFTKLLLEISQGTCRGEWK